MLLWLLAAVVARMLHVPVGVLLLLLLHPAAGCQGSRRWREPIKQVCRATAPNAWARCVATAPQAGWVLPQGRAFRPTPLAGCYSQGAGQLARRQAAIIHSTRIAATAAAQRPPNGLRLPLEGIQLLQYLGLVAAAGLGGGGGVCLSAWTGTGGTLSSSNISSKHTMRNITPRSFTSPSPVQEPTWAPKGAGLAAAAGCHRRRCQRHLPPRLGSATAAAWPHTAESARPAPACRGPVEEKQRQGNDARLTEMNGASTGLACPLDQLTQLPTTGDQEPHIR